MINRQTTNSSNIRLGRKLVNHGTHPTSTNHAPIRVVPRSRPGPPSGIPRLFALSPTFPVDTSGDLPEHIGRHRIPIIRQTNEILDRLQLLDDETDVAIKHRSCPFQMRGLIPTLMVVTKWVENASPVWPQAALEIMTVINNTFQDSKDSGPTLHVEMLAPERTMKKYLGGVEHMPDLEKGWPGIKKLVRERLEAFEATRSYMNQLGLFRLGYSQDREMNPITVYICVDYDSDESKWDEVLLTSGASFKLRDGTAYTST
ncbi:hypothetical protein B0T10DRAFT_579666 [Thelonectria olida]|uniref:Uncharacterized protein n=1 Tax=Thelonectria olida TaxID=1576542 RepID=A0A9P8VXD6_9HYPO|nr:hypothetical protein B0T10DRAFT_579666 [Thelonectria olida]